MRLGMAAIAAGVVLALVLPFGAEAGGKGAVRATIYEGGVYPTPAGGRTYADGDEVGFAILNATTDDTMTIMIKIQDGLADTTFDVTFVPATSLDPDINWEAPPLSLTTDQKGKGSLTVELDIPQGYVDAGVAQIKVILTSAEDPDDIYVTDDRDPPFVNPPDAYPGSTTHAVNLK